MPAVNFRQRNQAVWRFIALPFVFLTVMLLGGLRVGLEKSNFIFVAPPLICLILASLLMILFLRGKLIIFPDWISGDSPLLANVANILTLLALFAASAQAFNSVLPESGVFFWLFVLFFLWTLWNNLFSEFDAKRLLRSLAVLFGTAFLLKHLVLTAFAAPLNAEKSLSQKITGLILESLDVPNVAQIAGASNFAPLTGYISFFAVGLYIVGLIGLIALLPRSTDKIIKTADANTLETLSSKIAALSAHEQKLLLEQLIKQQISEESVSESLAAADKKPVKLLKPL